MQTIPLRARMPTCLLEDVFAVHSAFITLVRGQYLQWRYVLCNP